MIPGGWREWLRSDKGLALALFVTLSSIYFATITGITSSNDGSHYAAVRAIVENGTFEITPFWDFTEHQDFVRIGKQRFSDRPPGTALIAAATYGLGQVLPPQIALLPSKHDPDNPRMIYAVMASSLLMGGAATLFFFSLRRHFDVSSTGSLLGSLALGLGTTYWKYGSLLYSHAAAAFLIIAGLFLLFEAENVEHPSWLHGLGIGAALGISVLAEYSNAIFAALAVIYVIAVFGPAFISSIRSTGERPAWFAVLGAFAIGGLVPLIFLLIYNTVNFGGPLELSMFKVNLNRWPAAQNLATMFGAPIIEGAVSLAWYGSDNQGLFLLSPIALVGLPGLIDLVRGQRRRGLLLVGLWVVMFLVMSSHDPVNPLTNDSRYLTPFLGLWFVPVALWLDRHFVGKSLNTPAALLFALVVFAALLLSIRNQFMVIALSWNHDLDLAALKPDAIPLENISAVFGAVFRNPLNLPLLWLVEAIGAVVVIAARTISRRIGAGASTSGKVESASAEAQPAEESRRKR